MPIVRTPKGTAQLKASGTALSVTGISFVPGALCEVGVVYLSATVHPTFKFGKRDFKLVAGSRVTHLGAGMTTAKYRTVIRGANTRNVDGTWPEAIGARAMYVTQWEEVSAKNVGNTATQTADPSPATGVAVATTRAETGHAASFGSNGPSGDTPGVFLPRGHHPVAVAVTQPPGLSRAARQQPLFL